MTKKVVRTSEEKALLDFQSRPKVMFNQGEKTKDKNLKSQQR